MTPQRKAIAIGAAGLAAFLLFRPKRLTATVTTSEGFDLEPYGGMTVYPAPIKRTAEAIARAEGFYVRGSIPQRAHNPGDLKVPNWTGPTLGSGISVFQSDDAGWAALYKQLQAILTGRSNYYNLDMTIADMGNVWTATQKDSWAANVAGFLAVPVTTPLYSVLV